MTKKITIEIEEGYVCGDLETLRTMSKTKDFSSLDAVIERIQIKVNNMESGLHNSKYRKAWIKIWGTKEKDLNEDFIKKLKDKHKLSEW